MNRTFFSGGWHDSLFFNVVCAFIQFLKCAIFSYSRPLWCYTKGDTISMHFSKILLDENSMNLCHYRSVGWESEGKCIYGSWLLEVSYLFSSGSLPFKIWVREAELSWGEAKEWKLFSPLNRFMAILSRDNVISSEQENYPRWK